MLLLLLLFWNICCSRYDHGSSWLDLISRSSCHRWDLFLLRNYRLLLLNLRADCKVLFNLFWFSWCRFCFSNRLRDLRSVFDNWLLLFNLLCSLCFYSSLYLRNRSWCRSNIRLLRWLLSQNLLLLLLCRCRCLFLFSSGNLFFFNTAQGWRCLWSLDWSMLSLLFLWNYWFFLLLSYFRVRCHSRFLSRLAFTDINYFLLRVLFIIIFKFVGSCSISIGVFLFRIMFFGRRSVSCAIIIRCILCLVVVFVIIICEVIFSIDFDKFLALRSCSTLLSCLRLVGSFSFLYHLFFWNIQRHWFLVSTFSGVCAMMLLLWLCLWLLLLLLVSLVSFTWMESFTSSGTIIVLILLSLSLSTSIILGWVLLLAIIGWMVVLSLFMYMAFLIAVVCRSGILVTSSLPFAFKIL